MGQGDLSSCVTKRRDVVLQSDMPKPPTSVRSIRLPNELWGRVAAMAKDRGLSINAYVQMCVSPLQVKPVPPSPMTWPSGVVVDPADRSDPGIEAPGRLVMARAPFGSRLKGAKK